MQMNNLHCGKFASQPFGKPGWRIPKIKPVVHNHQKLHSCDDLITGKNSRAMFHTEKFPQEHSRI